MNNGFLFAIISAILFGFWTVFHDKASKNVDSLIGAIIISLTAVVLGLIIISFNSSNGNFLFTWKGVLFSVFAGICALGIDYFALKAYTSGLEISIVGPVIFGGSILTATIIGIILGESITILKLLGIISIIIGTVILSTF